MIESKQNQRVKRWKKLHKRKYRDQEGQALVEGWHSVEEVLKSDWHVYELIIKETIELPQTWKTYEHVVVAEDVFSELSQTETNQGVIAVVEQPQERSIPTAPRKILCLDSIQDPGNLGTIIRSGLAFGIDLIVLGEGTVDVFNHKVIRATQGALFHIPVIRGDNSSWIDYSKQHQIPVYATALDQQALPLKGVKKGDSYTVIMGNEGNGVRPELIQQADHSLYIPIASQSESLNVAVATSIVLYHFHQLT
ncbi:TrmH family RNA methyltransferase [Alkalibacillus almallahensis]|uniref:TrmH family RNA methyltransferase n=1 Tax=Alkalibacillus almallahensis TaxID=1379154 RepID=UPI00141DD918|nr:RNA methyltransferase [Alkalibacillus almallahensis]NIK11112.1 TrmH family RNA methyltransferase [Alkalibacillus almallahensis]